MNFAKRWLSCAVLAFAIAVPAGAQWVKPLTQRGFVPGASFDVSNFDSVDMVNGNVTLRIPLTALPPSPGGLSQDVTVTYNSGRFNLRGDMRAATVATNPPNGFYRHEILEDTGAWGLGYSYGLEMEVRAFERAVVPIEVTSVWSACEPPPTPHTAANVVPQAAMHPYRVRAVFPDGSQHVLFTNLGTLQDPASYWTVAHRDTSDGDGWYPYDPAGNGPGCDSTNVPANFNGGITYYTLDGTYVRVVMSGNEPVWTNRSWTMYFPDGRKVRGHGEGTDSIEDRNGNVITINHGPNGTETLSDAWGRSITIAQETTKTIVTQAGYGGTPLTWTLWSSSPTLTFNYNCNEASEPCLPYSGYSWRLDRIEFPTTTAGTPHVPSATKEMLFTYATTFGDLTRVTLPRGSSMTNGGQIDYEYLHGAATEFPVANGAIDYPVLRKTLLHRDPDTQVATSEVWTYDIKSLSYGASPGAENTVINPDGSVDSHHFYPPYASLTNGQVGGHTYKIEKKQGTTLISRSEDLWTQNQGPGSLGSPYIKASLNTLGGSADGLTDPSAFKEFTYDLNGNVTVVKEYDWIGYSSTSGMHSPTDGFLNKTPTQQGMTPVRTTTNTYTVYTDNAAFPPNTSNPVNPPGAYWTIPIAPFRAMKSTKVEDPGLRSYSEFVYDAKDNLLEDWKWDSTQGAFLGANNHTNMISIKRTYTLSGDLCEERDPRDIVVRRFEYGSTVCIEQNEILPTDLYEAYGRPEQRHFKFEYDPNTGLQKQEKDVDNNNLITVQADYDPRGRIKEIIQSGMKKTLTIYNDASQTVTTQTDFDGLNDSTPLETIVSYDDLGRVWKTRDNKLGIDTLQFSRNDSSGTYTLASNPFLATTDSTMGWTRTRSYNSPLDGHKIVEVRHYNGAAKPSPWGSSTDSSGATTTDYRGNEQLVTELAEDGDVTRALYSDGLGRLRKVIEAGANTTTYVYNGADNLTDVFQGSQHRIFDYSSLGRLNSSNNPENGLIGYTYDLAGNLLTRTDARGVITTNSGYDGLNRPASRSYTGGSPATPQVTFTYDDTCQKGQLCSVSNSVSSSSYTYDVLGRITTNTQTTGGTAYTFPLYGYKLNGALSQIIYPSGRNVTYTFDAGGRPTGASGVLSAVTTPYANSVQYAPHGAIKSMNLGTSLNEQWTYNKRLQPEKIQVGTLMTLDFGYGTKNNGNVQSQAINRQGALLASLTYGYDTVNRLTGATGPTGWSQGYNYDQYGNRTISPAQQTAETPTGFQSNNRVSGWHYDLAGNVVGIPVAGATTTRASCVGAILPAVPVTGMLRTSCYDGEGHMVSETDSTGKTSTYEYDGQGRRVRKTVGTVTTTYVYDAAGQLAAEYGGEVPADSGTRYLFTDHLGSTRLTAKGDGSDPKPLDYYPFGEEVTASGTPQVYPSGAAATALDVKFTAHLRDAETGLDFMQARYYSNVQGRFTSVDPLMESADPAFPQSWNRYTYGLNNPLRYIDPTGMEAISAEECQKNPDCVSVAVNVMYDQNAQLFDRQGNVLPAVQQKINEQIAAAQDAYGNALVSFAISYSTGSIEGFGNNQRPTGVQTGKINVMVTDSRETFTAGGAVESNGTALIRLNAGTSDRGTLSHELGHVLAGDTKLPNIPILKQAMNAVLDFRTDVSRMLMPLYSPYHGNRFDPPPGQRLPVTNLFNQGAQRFRSR